MSDNQQNRLLTWWADGVSWVEVGVDEAFACHPVQIRRLVRRITHHAQVCPAHLKNGSDYKHEWSDIHNAPPPIIWKMPRLQTRMIWYLSELLLNPFWEAILMRGLPL